MTSAYLSGEYLAVFTTGKVSNDRVVQNLISAGMSLDIYIRHVPSITNIHAHANVAQQYPVSTTMPQVSTTTMPQGGN